MAVRFLQPLNKYPISVTLEVSNISAPENVFIPENPLKADRESLFANIFSQPLPAITISVPVRYAITLPFCAAEASQVSSAAVSGV